MKRPDCHNRRTFCRLAVSAGEGVWFKRQENPSHLAEPALRCSEDKSIFHVQACSDHKCRRTRSCLRDDGQSFLRRGTGRSRRKDLLFLQLQLLEEVSAGSRKIPREVARIGRAFTRHCRCFEAADRRKVIAPRHHSQANRPCLRHGCRSCHRKISFRVFRQDVLLLLRRMPRKISR